MSKCTGITGRIFGHKFTPCIVLGNDLMVPRHVSTTELVNLKACSRVPDEYARVGMICLRCGVLAGDWL